jgi:hypothetical protein
MDNIRTWQELSDSFDSTVADCDAIIARIERSLAMKTKCASCPTTDNLTEVTARPDSKYFLCPRCKAEESQS